MLIPSTLIPRRLRLLQPKKLEMTGQPMRSLLLHPTSFAQVFTADRDSNQSHPSTATCFRPHLLQNPRTFGHHYQQYPPHPPRLAHHTFVPNLLLFANPPLPLLTSLFPPPNLASALHGQLRSPVVPATAALAFHVNLNKTPPVVVVVGSLWKRFQHVLTPAAMPT